MNKSFLFFPYQITYMCDVLSQSTLSKAFLLISEEIMGCFRHFLPFFFIALEQMIMYIIK